MKNIQSTKRQQEVKIDIVSSFTELFIIEFVLENSDMSISQIIAKISKRVVRRIVCHLKSSFYVDRGN